MTVMDFFVSELRQTFRRLQRSPLFASITILTLALGIGANTAVFSVVNGVLLKPLAFPEPERLIGVWQSALGLGIQQLNASPSTYFTYREESKTFEDIGLWGDGAVTITGNAEPERVDSLAVTDGVLPLLRVQPMLGRRFTAQDDSHGQPETVMLSHGYWQRKFGADPSIVGKRILIDSRAHEVIGVLPANFRFMNLLPSVLLPFQFNRNEIKVGNFSYQALARLKPGFTLQQASSDVARMLPMLPQKFGLNSGMSLKMLENAKLVPNLRWLKDDVVGDVGKLLWILMASIGIVLLIACANVANLLLVRVDGRQREIAVRTALGASRMRIAGSLILESSVLGLAGGIAGIGIAYGAVQVLHAFAPPYLLRLDEISIDIQSLLFAAVMSLLTGIFLGLIPAWKYVGPALNQSLRNGGRTMSEGRERQHARSALVVVQVALAVVLLIGAGLMIRTMIALGGVAPGFTHPEKILTFRLSIPSTLAPNAAALARVDQNITGKLASIPGVESVGISSSITMDGNMSYDPIYTEDRQYKEGEIPTMRRYKYVAPNFFRSMGNPLQAGRDLTWTDIHALRPVVLVSENLAIEFWGSPSAAIGKRVRESSTGLWREVVGVVGNERDKGADQPAPTIVYWPFIVKGMWGKEVMSRETVSIAIRSSRAGTSALMDEVRKSVWSVNPDLPIANPRTVQAIYASSMARTSFTLTMLSIASGLALLLGIIGIYGVISYSIAQRTREIGIRIAIGSPGQKVRQLFVGHALRLAVIGVSAGLVLAYPIGKVLSSLLFGVSPVDPATYLIVALAILLAAGLASYLPARRASNISPLEALSSE